MTPQDLAYMFHTSGLAEADSENLEEFYKACQAPILFGRYLFPDKPPGYAVTTRELGVYCAYIILALAQRGSGQISDAIMNEKKADEIYDALPDFAKW